MGSVNESEVEDQQQPSSFDDRPFDAAVERSTSNVSYLGSFDQLYAVIQMLGAELCEKLDDPDLDGPSRQELLIQIVEPVVEMILSQEGEWYSADRLKRQLELADPTNSGPDLAYVLREFFYQYAIELGQMIRYANTPGVLPEQWNWQPKAMTTRAALLLHGYEIEDEESLVAYNAFVSGKSILDDELEELIAIANQAYLEEQPQVVTEPLQESALSRVVQPINVVVNMPEQKPPEVVIHNHIEPTKMPDVVVNPVVNVSPEIVLPKPREVTVTRDSDGKITGLQTKAE
jgi:hypothetical protein